MSGIVLPPVVEWNEQRAKLAERHGALRWFDDALKEFDPLMELVRAPEGSTDPDLIPGYWHIRRRNPIGLHTYIAITGPEGEFTEPHSGVIEQLRKMDLQRKGAWEELMQKLDDEEAASRRKVQETRDDLKEEFADRYKAYANPGVLFGDNKWTWRSKAKRAVAA